jgi:hypothetical protein
MLTFEVLESDLSTFRAQWRGAIVRSAPITIKRPNSVLRSNGYAVTVRVA